MSVWNIERRRVINILAIKLQLVPEDIPTKSNSDLMLTK